MWQNVTSSRMFGLSFETLHKHLPEDIRYYDYAWLTVKQRALLILPWSIQSNMIENDWKLKHVKKHIKWGQNAPEVLAAASLFMVRLLHHDNPYIDAMWTQRLICQTADKPTSAKVCRDHSNSGCQGWYRKSPEVSVHRIHSHVLVDAELEALASLWAAQESGYRWIEKQAQVPANSYMSILSRSIWPPQQPAVACPSFVPECLRTSPRIIVSAWAYQKKFWTTSNVLHQHCGLVLQIGELLWIVLAFSGPDLMDGKCENQSGPIMSNQGVEALTFPQSRNICASTILIVHLFFYRS